MPVIEVTPENCAHWPLAGEPVVVTVPPPAGALHVPSALRKLVVPPPLLGTRPCSVELKRLRSAVSCVLVTSIGGAALAVLFPLYVWPFMLAKRALASVPVHPTVIEV